MQNLKIITLSLMLILTNNFLSSDSFKYNTFNNHGVVGLVNMPTARFFDNSVHGMTFYDGTPDQKVTLSSNPYDWLEASFFYTNIQGKPYPCLLYTSDAADDLTRVDLGGRRIIKKKNDETNNLQTERFFFSSRRRHTRFALVSWARRCV